MTLEEFRAQNPDYNDLSDGELAFALWDSGYKDSGLPMGMFADQIDLSGDGFEQMLSTANAVGYEPTTETFSENYEPSEGDIAAGRALTAMRGATAGISENIAAATAAGAEKVFGDRDRSYGEAFKDYLNLQRDVMERYAEAKPIESTAVEVGSAILPAVMTGGGSVAATGPARAATTAGAAGFTYGAATGGGESADISEDIKQRIEDGSALIIPSALFGGGGQFAFNLGKNVVRRLKNPLDTANTNPTVENLGRLRTAAYKAADNAGIVFSSNVLEPMKEAGLRITQRLGYPRIKTPRSLERVQGIFNRYVSRPQLTLTELDQLRKDLYEQITAKTSKSKKRIINQYIRLVDNAIDAHPDASGVMNAARAANKRYMKSQELAEVLGEVRRQAGQTGMGGNAINLYRQAVKRLLKKPDTKRFWNDQEMLLLQKFADLEPDEKWLRGLGAFDPTAGRLTLLLNSGFVGGPALMGAFNPLSMLPAVVGAAARRGAEGQVERRGQQLFEAISSGTGELPAIAPRNISARSGQVVGTSTLR